MTIGVGEGAALLVACSPEGGNRCEVQLVVIRKSGKEREARIIGGFCVLNSH